MTEPKLDAGRHVVELDAARVPVPTRRISPAQLISSGVLVVLGLLFVAPLLWVLSASVDAHASTALQFPTFTLTHFKQATSSANLRSLVNSFYISGVATVVATVPAALAAYAFSRYHIPWKGPLLLLILMLSGIPVTLLVVPVYQEFANENLLSILPAAVFLGVTVLPLELWIIKNFIDAIPSDLEEAARLEHASTPQIILRIVVPLALPGIAGAAILGFVLSWGNFLVPLVLLTSPAQQPSPVALFSFFGSETINYGGIAAYSILYSLPVVFLYLGAGRLMRGGFSFSGALRG